MRVTKRSAAELHDEQETLDTCRDSITPRKRRTPGQMSREQWDEPRPMAPKICCRQCGGSGWQEMPVAYQQTLAVLSAEWRATSDVLAKLNAAMRPSIRVKATALCNRLADMLADGLVERRRMTTKSYEWRLVP